MLTPHVIAHLNDLVRLENAASVEIEYDRTGRVTRVTSLDNEGDGAHALTSDMLTPRLVDACQAFVDYFDHDPEGGSMRYVPEEGTPHGDEMRHVPGDEATAARCTCAYPDDVDPAAHVGCPEHEQQVTRG
jgi:hypothetical protein